MTEYDDKTRSEPGLVVEDRRAFLRSLGKWSQAVIGGAVIGSASLYANPAQAWAAARGPGGSVAVGGGGGWVNRYGGGGGWINGGGGGGGWINGGGGGGGWVNRYGGGGSWINR